jgi:hypothetical protein
MTDDIPGRAGIIPQVIKASAGKTILLLVLSVGFVLIGGSEIISEGASVDFRAWLGVMFFGLGAIVFSVLLFRPMIIALDLDGFTVSGGLIRNAKLTPWRDVEGFFVYKLPRGGKLVGYNYTAGASSRSKMASINKLLGAEAALPKGFVLSPEKLAETMNDYRERALDLRPNSVTVPKFGRRTFQ